MVSYTMQHSERDDHTATKSRFEQISAYVLGVALPLLEVVRRGSHIDSLSLYVDDFIAGGLLLYAAVAMTRKNANAPVLLVMAWAVLCGGMYYSFFAQLQNTLPNDISGLPSLVVVLIKGGIFVLAIVCLYRSVRSANQSGTD